MSRRETMLEDKWRVQAFFDGRVIREQLGDEKQCRVLAAQWIQTADEVCLEVRRAGRHRFELVQAEGWHADVLFHPNSK